MRISAPRRRLRISDFEGLVSGKQRFRQDMHILFSNRDLTRADLRQLMHRGLSATGGNCRAVVQRFGMDVQNNKNASSSTRRSVWARRPSGGTRTSPARNVRGRWRDKRDPALAESRGGPPRLP
jgi:hypothetical protein